MKRRVFLGAATAAGAGLLGYGASIEPRTLDVSLHALRLSAAGAAPRGDEEANVSTDTLRLLQISDLPIRAQPEVAVFDVELA